MKSSIYQFFVGLLVFGSIGICQTVSGQSTNLTEVDRLQRKEAANKQQERITSRTAADLKTVQERKVQVSEIKTTAKQINRDVQKTRTAEKVVRSEMNSKGSTAERDARSKILQDERRAQKASYLNAKVATEPSTTEREKERKITTRNSVKKEKQ